MSNVPVATALGETERRDGDIAWHAFAFHLDRLRLRTAHRCWSAIWETNRTVGCRSCALLMPVDRRKPPWRESSVDRQR